MAETFGTEKLGREKILDPVLEHFDLRPGASAAESRCKFSLSRAGANVEVAAEAARAMQAAGDTADDHEAHLVACERCEQLVDTQVKHAHGAGGLVTDEGETVIRSSAPPRTGPRPSR